MIIYKMWIEHSEIILLALIIINFMIVLIGLSFKAVRAILRNKLFRV